MQSEFVDIQAKQNIQDESETRSSHTQSERPFLRPRGLLDRLSYRRTVTLEIAVAAVDRLDRVTPPRERARAQLCAVARQRDIPQGGHPVVKCDTACRRVNPAVNFCLESHQLADGRSEEHKSELQSHSE